jgi:heat-inducible transcriptional repressor
METLDARSREVLVAVIAEYVRTAEPVGSRAVARRHLSSLSPATIRNVMSDLEEMGYLTHPHTSAGRVPTDKAYRFYVDHLERVPWIGGETTVAARAPMPPADAAERLMVETPGRLS